MNWQEICQRKLVSLDEAAKVIKSTDRAFFRPEPAPPSRSFRPFVSAKMSCTM